MNTAGDGKSKLRSSQLTAVPAGTEDPKQKKKEFKEEERKQKETVKEEKKLEKKKNKEEKKRIREEERERERADRIREKEEKRQAEKKREMRKERRRSFLKGGGGGFDFSAFEEHEQEAPATPGEKAPKEKKKEKVLSPEILKRQRELEQFLLNVPRKKLRGTTWMYYDVAPASGYTDTVVLLHGGGIRPEAMHEHILELAQTYRVVAPWFPEYFVEMEDYAAGLILIMRHESIKKAHFFGVGFGAIVALHFLYRHPGRVVNCILMYSAFPSENRARSCEKALKKSDFSYGPLLRILTGHLAKSKDVAEHVVNLTAGEREMWVNNFRKFAATKQALTVRVLALEDFHLNCVYTAADMERWKGRMLLLESEDDEYFDPEYIASLQEVVPSASVHYFNGTGHLFGLIRGSLVVARIREFLENEDETCTTSRTDLSARTDDGRPTPDGEAAGAIESTQKKKKAEKKAEKEKKDEEKREKKDEEKKEKKEDEEKVEEVKKEKSKERIGREKEKPVKEKERKDKTPDASKPVREKTRESDERKSKPEKDHKDSPDARKRSAKPEEARREKTDKDKQKKKKKEPLPSSM